MINLNCFKPLNWLLYITHQNKLIHKETTEKEKMDIEKSEQSYYKECL